MNKRKMTYAELIERCKDWRTWFLAGTNLLTVFVTISILSGGMVFSMTVMNTMIAACEEDDDACISLSIDVMKWSIWGTMGIAVFVYFVGWMANDYLTKRLEEMRK